MRHDHEFIGIGRVAGLPGRDFQIHFSRRGGNNFHRRPMGAHQRLQQRVARQPVRAVQSGAGRLAHRKQPRDVSGPVHVCHHAAALIMSRGHHGNGLLGDVDAVAQTGFVDVGKAIDDEPGRLVRDVQMHTVRPGRRADTVSALRLREGESAEALVRALDAVGWQVATGKGDQRDTVIRIGHMGDRTVDELNALLSALEPLL